jgi:hypothetical protein
MAEFSFTNAAPGSLCGSPDLRITTHRYRFHADSLVDHSLLLDLLWLLLPESQDQELLDIVKKLLSEQSSLSATLSAEEISSLKEQKILLSREVELRKDAAERAMLQANEEAAKKAQLQNELDAVAAELAAIKAKSRTCALM